MTCRDVWEIADSFLSEELPTETTHEILGHLEACPMCRTEIGARRRLRGALRDALGRAPELQPSADFGNRLREQLRDVSLDRARPWFLSRRWLALAASVVLALGVAGVVLTKRSVVSAEALARDAIGDHQNCALNTTASRHNSGDQTNSRGCASSICANEGPRLMTTSAIAFVIARRMGRSALSFPRA